MDIESLKSRIDRAWGYRVMEEERAWYNRNRTRGQWLFDLKSGHVLPDTNAYLFLEALDLQTKLTANGLRFCFIGGIPLQWWGEVRHTTDVDLTVFCQLGDELDAFSILESLLESRIEDPRELLRLGRMYLGTMESGRRVDISIGFTPYERRMMDRAVDVDYGVSEPLHICSAEDLAITKTIAGRGQDWVDLRRIIQRSGESMDWDLVWKELGRLLKLVGEEERLERLREMVDAEYPPKG